MLKNMSVGPLTTNYHLREAYRRVNDRVVQALHRAGRRPDDAILVAVTTDATPDQIRMLVDMGHLDLGETEVQHLGQRVAQLSEFLHRRHQLAGAAPKHTPVVMAGRSPGESSSTDSVRWHMVGTVQRTKVRHVVPVVRLIHSIDSLRLAEELHSFLARKSARSDSKNLPTVAILVQANATGDSAIRGVLAPAVRHVCEQIDTMVHLRLRGLMAQTPPDCDDEATRTIFSRTADIFREIREMKVAGREFNILSMGNSDNFEPAIEHGANIVRVGRALFKPEEIERV